MKINLLASTKEEYFEKFLTLTSALSPLEMQLSPLEVVLLAKFMALEAPYKYFPFSPRAKKEANSKLDKPYSTSNLSIKLCSLVDKKYLIRADDGFLDFSPAVKKMVQSETLDVILQLRPNSKEDVSGS
jgi:hypothetical protein